MLLGNFQINSYLPLRIEIFSKKTFLYKSRVSLMRIAKVGECSWLKSVEKLRGTNGIYVRNINQKLSNCLKNTNRSWVQERTSLCLSSFYSGFRRNLNEYETLKNQNKKYSLIMLISLIMFGVSAGFSIIPIYRLLCQSSGFGGYIREEDNIINIKPVPGEELIVHFDTKIHSDLPWEFTPLQEKITVTVGEPALAFYRAKNTSSEPITGISSYALVPFGLAKYFVKIQCFCFEEQRLEPGEEVDMPVFFFIDPDILNSPSYYYTKDVFLHYLFFKSRNSEYYESLRRDSSISLPGIS